MLHGLKRNITRDIAITRYTVTLVHIMTWTIEVRIPGDTLHCVFNITACDNIGKTTRRVGIMSIMLINML